MRELMIDFITTLDGYASGEGWPGFWGLEGPEYLGWLGLYNGVLEPVVAAKFRGDLTAVQADAYAALDRRWREALDRGPYLLGDQFSAVDILFGSLLLFYRAAMPQYPVYDAYLARIGERPALTKAMTKDARPDG